MTTQAMPIGEAARQSGVKVPTIRYYEQIGLLPAPPRNEGNRRQYDTEDLRQRGAQIMGAGALTPTPSGVKRGGRSSGVPVPACD